MNNTVFSNNLKKLRLQKNLTQEQVAEILGVNAQTVSRWECSTTQPDIMMLPEIAKLYCVTIDDLYKEVPCVYDNYFQRLAAVYHKTKAPEDFFRAYAEFQNMLKASSPSFEDRRIYGLIHQLMAAYCIDVTSSYFDEILENKEKSPENIYWLTKSAKANFSVLLGTSDEFISEQRKAVQANPNDVDELCVLLRALCYARKYEEAYDILEAVNGKFTDSSKFYSVSGDICRKLKKYNEALDCWDKAIELNNGFLLDGQYSKAFCYEELGEWEKAHELRLDIAKQLRRIGNDIEAEIQEKRAMVCFEKGHKSAKKHS